jgi:hypothetical protein
MEAIEQLGVVSTRSGILLVIDTGYLGLWSHDRQPLMPDGVLPNDALRAQANSAVDIQITGSDAERAGRLLNISWHPLYLYDQPAKHPDLVAKFKAVKTTHNLDAEMRILSERIPHRRRLELALMQGVGAGEMQFDGVWASAVSGVPRGQELAVKGERLASDSWARVFVECRPGLQIVSSEYVGMVGVDYARLLISDPDVLGEWRHNESLDGRADYVFWGKDAAHLAAIFAATEMNGQYGWLDLPEGEAQRKARVLRDYQKTYELKVGPLARYDSDANKYNRISLSRPRRS